MISNHHRSHVIDKGTGSCCCSPNGLAHLGEISLRVNTSWRDKRLARPVVIPIKVDLTHDEKKTYVECSIKIRNISGYLIPITYT